MVLNQEKYSFKINKKKVVHRLINNEAVILHLEKGFYYSLNKAGTLIWKLIEKGSDFTEISQALAKEFDCKGKDIKKDIKALIVDLEKERLIEKT